MIGESCSDPVCYFAISNNMQHPKSRLLYSFMRTRSAATVPTLAVLLSLNQSKIKKKTDKLKLETCIKVKAHGLPTMLAKTQCTVENVET